MKIMEKTALKCSSCDELIMCAKQIAALGNIMSLLAQDESEHLIWHGDEFGTLLSSFGELIESDLTALYPPIQDAYYNYDNSFLAELTEKLELVQQRNRAPGRALDQTKDSIKKIDLFLDKDLSPILRMRGKFETIEADINQRLMGKDSKKGAAEGIADQPAAQEPDTDKSNSDKVSHK